MTDDHPAAGLWFHEAGEAGAPLVVLIHGAMDRSASMVKLSRQLDGEFRVLRYDRRGYGRSKPHPGPFTMDDHVADLVELLAGRRALVVGHSYGGNVALATAARHPSLVRAVLVYEVPLPWMDWWPGSSRRIGTGLVMPPEEVAERFMRRVVGDDVWESLPERVRDERRAEGAALSSEFADMAGVAPWSEDDIVAPVRVLYGTNTVDRHRRGCEYVADRLSDEPPITIADAGHHGPLTHPREVAAEVRRLSSAAP